MIVDEVMSDIQVMMDKTLERVQREMNQVRTGRASAALVEDLHVNYYGTQTALRQLATISVPNPRMMVVQPWDASASAEIEKAILRSGVGLNPSVEGNVIRLPVPPLSEERRRELVKVVHRMAEECRVTVRNERRKSREKLKTAEKAGELSEDDSRKALAELQKVTDDHVEKVDKLMAAKEKDIMEV